MKAFFRFGAGEHCCDALRFELQSLAKPGESRWFWIAASFVVDRITTSSEGVRLYYVRRPRQRKEKTVILQGDWPGIEYLHLQGDVECGCLVCQEQAQERLR